jgi:predicted transcriptional regulator of viral defense system
MKKQKPQYAVHWIEEMLGQGRHTFTSHEAQKSLKVSRLGAYRALHRLEKDARLARLKTGFYVIVEPQHRAARIPPADWFIDDFMKSEKKPYYVSLLSAARIHGASHHAPMIFQVMIPTKALRPRPIVKGNLKIRFFSKNNFDLSETSQVKTPTGYETVSTPETTAWDLVRYSKSAGGLDNVITVLSELSSRIDAGKLLATVKRHEDPFVARRLGWLLDKVGRKELTSGISKWVGNKLVPFIPLDSSEGFEKAAQNAKWRIWVNTQLEPEA